MIPTPRERIDKALNMALDSGELSDYAPIFLDTMEQVVTSAIADQTAALQAALEELAKCKQERDQALESSNIQCEIRYSELARAEKAEQERDDLAAKIAGCKKCGGCGYVAEDVCGYIEVHPCNHGDVLAAHDRKVAARVLREASKQIHTTPWWALGKLAEEYEAGTREVPGE